jgi:hypothetical protein
MATTIPLREDAAAERNAGQSQHIAGEDFTPLRQSLPNLDASYDG